MELVTAADMRIADRRAAEAGVSEGLLMEAAGRAVLDALRQAWPEAREVAVLCGPGNNGGDGFVVARAAATAGLRVRLLDLDPDRERSGAAGAARAAWRAFGRVGRLDAPSLERALDGADVTVDALFGSGLTRALEGSAAEVAARLSAWHGPVLAVDVPSGIAADRAVPPGPTVRATRTVQLASAKLASVLPPARFAFGTWTVADIGVPSSALSPARRPRLVTDSAAAAALPVLAPGAHKYDAGTVAVAAGSARYAGAAELTCRGAHRGGAGLVTLITPAGAGAGWPETIRLTPDDPDAPFDPAALLEQLSERRQGARVFGPGLASDVAEALAPAIAAGSAPTVLDASALLPSLREACRRHGACWLTPHVGEAARLLDVGADDVRSDPVGAARTLADGWRAGVVLKSAGAVVTGPDGRVRVVAAGHPAMASGGTGDVLAGLLGALLAARNGDPLESVAAGVHLHARAGERAARRYGAGLRASDLAEALPGARRSLGGAW